jgi:hypothetical protein
MPAIAKAGKHVFAFREVRKDKFFCTMTLIWSVGAAFQRGRNTLKTKRPGG